jgi:hypothetical protein
MTKHEYQIEDGGRVITLDATHRCEVEGCDWHVLASVTRCIEHGGPDDGTVYRTDAWGASEFADISSGDPVEEA